MHHDLVAAEFLGPVAGSVDRRQTIVDAVPVRRDVDDADAGADLEGLLAP